MSTQEQTANKDFPKPTIVLVHGSRRRLVPLDSRCHTGLYNVTVIRSESTPIPCVAWRPTLLTCVACSTRSRGRYFWSLTHMGGAVITQGGDDPRVRGLIYAGSPMPAAGESTNDCLYRFPGGDFAIIRRSDSIHVCPTEAKGTNILVKAEKYAYLLAADVPESKLALMIATQRPIEAAALADILTSAAWTSKPSWQIRPLWDPVIPQEEFRFEAERAHSTVIELKSSHAIPVTFPDVVVDVINQAARAVAE